MKPSVTAYPCFFAHSTASDRLPNSPECFPFDDFTTNFVAANVPCCRQDLIDPVGRRGYCPSPTGEFLDAATASEELRGSIPTSAYWVISAPAATVGVGSGNVLRSVLGNVATIMAMRVGGPDADVLSGILGGRNTASLLQNLPDYHVAVRMLQDGRSAEPFIFHTLRPAPFAASNDARRLIERNYVDSYTRPMDQVEKEIARRTTIGASEGPLTR